MIRTIDGTNAYKHQCVLIGDKFYIKDKHVVKYKGRWRILNQEVMIVDGTIVPKESNARVCEHIDPNTLEITFTEVPVSSLQFLPVGIFPNKCSQYAIDENVFLNAKFKECINDGNFYHNMAHAPQKCIGWAERDYRKTDQNCSTYEEKQKYGIISPTNMIAEGKKYTFGWEIETCSGMVPDRVLRNFNVKTMKDGSVRDEEGNKYTGAEYVSGVLFGDMGFRHTQEVCHELNKRTKINKTCGIHVHIGGCHFNKDFTICAYKLGQMIQDEVFAMFPKSRLEKNEHTGREYCKKLTPRNFALLKESCVSDYDKYRQYIEDYYNDIFYNLSNHRFPGPSINKNISQHPGGRWCNERYEWINFVGFNFIRENTDTYTIEFRCHSATTNFTKIKNWILICMAIAYYIENHQKEIILRDTISLAEILEVAFPRSHKILIDYVESRKQLFANPKFKETQEYETLDKSVNKKSLIQMIKEVCV